ncbi:unnamed protein product [Adineta ricciae]|nr:unnamed protein product [Adineta ricciae]
MVAVTYDFNNDSNLDLAVVNAYDNRVDILFGCGNGSFQSERISYTVGNDRASLIMDDFNDDNIMDLADVNLDEQTITMIIDNRNGTFTVQMQYSVGSAPRELTSGDFTNDNQSDIVVADTGGSNIMLLLDDGDGTLQDRVTYTIDTSSTFMTSDFAIVNTPNDTTGIMFGDIDGIFTSSVILSATGNNLTWITLDDFNNDAKLDLAVVNQKDNNIGVLFGYGNGSLNDQITFNVDLNGDKIIALVVTNLDDNSISVLFGNQDGTFQNQTVYNTGTGPSFAVSNDFNNDKILDIAVIHQRFNNVNILFDNRNKTFENQITYGIAGSWLNSIMANDFNKDEKSDMAINVVGKAHLVDCRYYDSYNKSAFTFVCSSLGENIAKMSEELILYHYPQSPFAEKIRMAMGLKKLNWRSVTVDRVPPRSHLEILTGGYRRIPVLQVGADIYCDTHLIIRTLDRLRPNAPTLLSNRMAQPLCWWWDKTMFPLLFKLLIGLRGDKLPREWLDD